jgi:5-amino-6-(5-phosphoribosylamino)uracil reductase
VRVFSNLAVSLDGKIADRQQPRHALGTPLDRKTMGVIRAQSDVIVIGANTLRASPHTMRVPKGLAKRSGRQPANAVVSASGNLDPDWKFWQDPEVVRFVFTTERGWKQACEAAQERAFVVKAGQDQVEIPRLLERLKKSGLERVLVEGGGELVSRFLEARCLHEMYVTLTPWLLGGRENPSLVGGAGLSPWAGLKVLKSKRVGQEFYFHYKVKGARRV